MKKLILIFLMCAIGFVSQAQMSSTQIDSLVNATLKAFDVPGISVGVIKDGKLIHAKGYGVRSITNNLPVDENTLFGIASNSKAFTATALAMLIDSGKLNWDDKVTDYIPEFQMFDPYVTREFTIRDLLTHRSGLGLGAGDLMFFPDGGNFTRKDVIHNLRFLKPVSSYRSQFDYDNNLYLVAGEIITKVSGLSWEEFIEQKIMQPLGFKTSTASYDRVKNNKNIIDAHAPADGKLVQIPHDWNPIVNAAGGIVSNITDLSKWLLFQLNNGVLPNGKRLVSAQNQLEMQQMQTIIPVGAGGPYNTHFYGYGLGWFISDVKGYKQISHTGGLAGTVTQTTIIPEIGLGIIVLTNQQQGVAFNTITNSIKDSYLGYGNRDWLGTYTKRYTAGNREADSIKKSLNAVIENIQKQKSFNPLNGFVVGNYKDDWFGKVTITSKDKGLYFQSEMSPRLRGIMLPYKTSSYIVKWDDRSLDADAYCVFSLDKDGKPTRFKMEAISPQTDFSFDFQDLDLKRVK